MKTRKLGSSDIVTSALGIGAMGMGGAHGPFDEDEAVLTVQRALVLGVTLVDTADFYGPGTSEKIIGRAIAGRRQEVVIASKTGMRRGAKPPPYVDGSPEYIRRAVDGSLQRLGTDRIDLYYLARVDPGVPVEDSVGALADLVRAGKVGAIGLCEASAASLRRASAVHPIAALQTEYSLWERHVEETILPTLRELNTALVAYRPLGNGFLTGSVPAPEQMAEGDLRRGDPRLQEENRKQNEALVAELADLAAARGVSSGQIALAWVLAQGEDIIPIPGTRRRTHLEQNVAAEAITLSPDETARLSAIFVPGATAGDRYPAFLMRLIDQS